jgi:hypothetical protein
MIPKILEFQKTGSSELGYISIVEQLINIPFEISRVYWTYFTPQNVERGWHANIDKEMVLVAVSGIIEVYTELQNGIKKTFILDRPDIGLYMPKLCWHTMKYSHNAVQMVIASNLYSKSDYIRNYNVFLNYGK